MLRLSLHRYVLSTTATFHLLLNVRSELDVLAESADVALYLMPWLEGEWNDRYETEREPFPALLLAIC